MYDKFFDNDFVEIIKVLEEKASAKGLEEKTETLRKFEGKGFCLKINALKKIANELGYKLNLELEENGSNTLLHFHIASALSKDYSYIFYVDLQNDNYLEYSSDSLSFHLILQKRGDNFFRDAKIQTQSSVHPEDRGKVLALFDKSRIIRELKEDGTDLFTFRLVFKGKPVYVKSKITRVRNGDKDFLVIGVSDVDAQVRRRLEYERAKEESLTFSRIAKALSRDYYSIYYIDANTDGYIEYASQYEYEELKIEKRETTFSATARKIFIKRFINRTGRDFCSIFKKRGLSKIRTTIKVSPRLTS